MVVNPPLGLMMSVTKLTNAKLFILKGSNCSNSHTQLARQLGVATAVMVEELDFSHHCFMKTHASSWLGLIL